MNLPAAAIPILQALSQAHAAPSDVQQHLLEQLQVVAPEVHAYVVRASQALLDTQARADDGLGFVWLIPIIASIAPIIANRLLNDASAAPAPTPTPSASASADPLLIPLVLGLGLIALLALKQ